MKKINVLSCVLVMLFMVSCMCFFSVSAEPDSDETTEKPVKTTEAVTTKATTEHHTTVATTKATVATVATTKANKTTKKTKKVTSADPVYTSKAKTSTNARTSGAGGVVTSHYATEEQINATKETKEIKTTEATTETTTAAKNIVDYGSKYRPIKWLSLVVMIGCVIALVAVNVRYKKKYGKMSGKGGKNGRGNNRPASKKNDAPRLDTSARFTEPKTPPTQQYQRRQPNIDENLDKTTVVDISSFSNKNRQNDFKPQEPKAPSPSAEKEDIFSTKNDDDDLYI